jgi:hypothetical protein
MRAQLGVLCSRFGNRAEVIEISGNPRLATVGDVQGFSCMCGLPEPHTVSVKMKQNGSWRVLLGQILLLASLALALAIVHWVHAGGEPFYLATDRSAMLFGGHG